MKTALALISLAFALTACTSPQQSAKNREDSLAATLNVYPDNRVGMKTESNWVWMARSDRVLAFEARGRRYNLKDVESVSRGQYDVTIIRLASGEEITAPRDQLRWLNCSTSKICEYSAPFDTNIKRESLNGVLGSIAIGELADPSTIKLGTSNAVDNPRSAIRYDSAAIPGLRRAGERFVVLKPAELAGLDMRVATVLREWDAKEPERKASEARGLEELRAAIKRRYDRLLEPKVGTLVECMRVIDGDLPTHVSLDCPSYGEQRIFCIDDFVKAGWSVASTTESQTSDALGRPFTRYRVRFQKIR